MLTDYAKSYAISLAMALESIGYDQVAMQAMFSDLQKKPKENVDAFLSFLKTTPVGFRLFCEIMTMLQAPQKAITFKL